MTVLSQFPFGSSLFKWWGLGNPWGDLTFDLKFAEEGPLRTIQTNKIPCSYFDKKAPSLESEHYLPRIEADLGRVFANSVAKDQF